jgi:hypothetical protein
MLIWMLKNFDAQGTGSTRVRRNRANQWMKAGLIKTSVEIQNSKIRNLKSAIEPLPLPSFHKQWKVVFPLVN